MADETDWSCRCGSVRARVDLHGSARVVCYCNFCQAFAHHTGAGDQLEKAGGTDLIQTVPERLHFVAGGEHLRCLRLSRKGPLRCYVACCGSPLDITIARRSLPYLALIAAGIADRERLSPVQVRANLASAVGPVDTTRQRWAAVLLGIARRTFSSWLSGGFRKTPFFDRDGKPTSPIERLRPEQKRAAFPTPKGS